MIIAIRWIRVNKTDPAIRWVVIDPVDNLIHFSTNLSLPIVLHCIEEHTETEVLTISQHNYALPGRGSFPCMLAGNSRII